MSDKAKGASEGASIEALRNKFRQAKGMSLADRFEAEARGGGKIDGRSLRRTGRTEQLAVRVTAKTKEAYQAYAARHDILLAEVLERALAALEAEERG